MNLAFYGKGAFAVSKDLEVWIILDYPSGPNRITQVLRGGVAMVRGERGCWKQEEEDGEGCEPK